MKTCTMSIRCLGGALVVLALLALPGARTARADTDADPSGHWEGTIEVPGQTMTIEIDLVRSAKGQLAGTLGNAAMGAKGLPLSSVSVAGRTVTFTIKATSGGGTFRGELGGDGAAMAGEFTTSDGAHAIPFRLARTGKARIAPPPKSPRIARELEGRWSGTLTVDGKEEHLVLTMTNHRDGTATGVLATADGGLQLPIAMTHKAGQLRVEVPSVGAGYTAVLNDARTELTGTWTQRSVALPLAFHRDGK